MTKSVIQPLETLRLAQYAVPIPCFVCGTDNMFDAEFCTHCSAPLALAHQADNKKVHPRLIAMVGPSAAGKTVYLGMLMDMLSRRPERMQMLARGAFSITLQQTTLAALARCAFPPKTPSEPERWNWVHCQMRRAGKRQTVEMIMPDMAGEALLEEVDHPHTYHLIRCFLEKCTGAMVLIDSIKLREGAREQDFFTMKLLSYLSELTSNDKAGWRKRPIALVLTKADQCRECMNDPAGYARTHAAGLWQHCQERFGRHKFFASGVAGTCAYRESMTEGRVQVPLRIEPHGVIEPFEWLLSELERSGKKS